MPASHHAGLAVRARVARILALSTTGLAALLIACASTPPGSEGVPAPRIDRSRMDSTMLQGHDYGSVYQAIMATHSDWLRPNGGTTSLGAPGKAGNTPVVGIFIDGSAKPLDMEALRALVPGNVKMIKKIQASESMVTYGPDWAWGAIVITLAH